MFARASFLLFDILVLLLILRFRLTKPERRQVWRRAVMLTAWGFALLMFLRTAWISEDAYLLFRSLEQLMAGRGPIWNPNERVQIFTSPLWYWLLALVRLFSRDVFLNAILVHTALYLLGLYLAWRVLSPWAFGFSLLLLWASNGFADYVTSGLEMELGFLLIALWVGLARKLHQEPQPSARNLQRFWLLTFLVMLARLDWALLVLPGLLWSLWTARKRFSPSWMLSRIFLAASPLLFWMGFALVYYGTPLPNTFYAKLTNGIPRAYWLQQGFRYYFGATLWIDPVTLVVPLTAILAGWWNARRAPWWAAGSTGLFIFLLYVGYIGGDFMLSRFFAVPFVMGWTLWSNGMPAVVRPPAWLALRNGLLLGALTIYHLLFIPTPLNTVFLQLPGLAGCGIEFERSIYSPATSLRAYLRYRLGWPSQFPGGWAREGIEFRKTGQPIVVRGAAGKFGYYAGTEVIIIDDYALGDPFRARLPALTTGQRVGHIHRPIPEGYLESHLTGRPMLKDRRLNTLLDTLLARVFLVTRGPLWTRPRWRAILFLLFRREKTLTAHLNLPKPTGPPPWFREPVWACASSLRPTGHRGNILWIFP